MKIYYQALKINYQVVKIYFQALKINLYLVKKSFLPHQKGFYIEEVGSSSKAGNRKKPSYSCTFSKNFQLSTFNFQLYFVPLRPCLKE